MHVYVFCSFLWQNWNSIIFKQSPLPSSPQPLATTLRYSCLWTGPLYRHHVIWIMQDWSFCDWLISLSRMSSGVIHAIQLTSSRLINTSLYIRITLSPSIHCKADVSDASSPSWDVTMRMKASLQSPFLFLSVTCSEVSSLGLRIILILIVWGFQTVFSSVYIFWLLWCFG